MAPWGDKANPVGLPASGRRGLLGLLTALPVLARAGTASAAAALTNTVAAIPFPEGVSLLVAGPSGGDLSRWADTLQPALEQSLPPDTSIRRVDVGGADGVTGANQFEARGAPDGLTVLLVPGDAVLAWLVGDPRAQFDVGHWVPVMAGVNSAIVVARQAAGTPNGVIRIGAAGPAGPDLPALLGLDLLGMRSAPVFGLADAGQLQNAFNQRAVDAVILRGHYMRDQLAAFTAAGGRPLFALGAHDEAGNTVRDPAFPDVPLLAEVCAIRSGRPPDGPLYDAWRASAAATQLDFGLVLPQLTPAAMVALWRAAGTEAAASLPLQARAITLEERSLGGPAATAATAAAAAHATALTALRQWLVSRFNWHPA